MKQLLSSEFYRLKKNKGVFATLIVALTLSILSPLFMTLMIHFIDKSINIGNFEVYGIDEFCTILSGSSFLSFLLFFTTTSYSCDDFKYGTIRNKIIIGYNRRKVYLAKLIINIFIGVVIQTIYAILSLLFFSLFLKFDKDNILSLAEFGNILNLLLTSILIQITTYSLLTALSLNIKKSNKTIIFFVVTLIGISAVDEVLQITFIELELYKVLELLTDINPTNQLNYIAYNELHTDLIILIIVTNIIYTVGISLIGMNSFNNKELK